MKNIAIIPARSGSKGVKNKNIKDLNGKPLMFYSIQAALQSGIFDEVMVSTDSRRYGEIAGKCGASVPFFRSELNSRDIASSWDTVSEVLDEYASRGIRYDNFCLLQPTSPLRDSEDIKKAYHLFVEKKAIAVISVCEMDYPITWCNTLNSDLNMKDFVHKENDFQRQAEVAFYRVNGAIYFANINEFNKDNYLYRNGCYAYIMDKKNSIDIDTEEDFQYVEFLQRR